MSAGAAERLPIPIPAGASEVVSSGPAPFVTNVQFLGSDGAVVHWQSRADRRQSPAQQRSLTWWIGLIFAIGSFCFVIGPIPIYAEWVGTQIDAATFFVGSLFFTTAAYLSYMQVARQVGHRWGCWSPRHIGFWATLIQLVGTVYFNMTTFRSLAQVPADMANQVIWRPDALGSICFLVASVFAFAEAGHRWWSWRPGERDWHITALNLWGSVFFGLSAIGAHYDSAGGLRNAQLANAGTFLGAVCFLAASLLLMPEGRTPPTV